MVNSNELRILFEYKENDVFRNLALEEAILLSINEGRSPNTFRIWINDSSAIAPFHENIFELINVEYCLDKGINISRRITGGGAIYNDLGNINWSFFFSRKPFEKFSLKELYSYFSSFIIKALEKLGLSLKYYEPNWLGYEGKKISGMAGYIKNNSILIHGTLLVDANLQNLEKVCKLHYKYPPVMNISSLKKIDIENIIQEIIDEISEDFKGKYEIKIENKLKEEEKKLLEELKNKYTSLNWIFG